MNASFLIKNDRNDRTFAIKLPSNISKCSLLFSYVGPSVDVRFSFELPSGYQPMLHKPIYGCIGIVHVGEGSGWRILMVDVFVGVIAEAEKAAELEGIDIYRISRVSFHCISSRKYEKLESQLASSHSPDSESLTHPCLGLCKLLNAGSFYFSSDFDLTRDMRARKSKVGKGTIDLVNLDYVWNKNILSDLFKARSSMVEEMRVEFDKSALINLCMQGFVGSETIVLGAMKYKMAIISRLSSNRAGTRFNARGIDDDGNVSNFVEVLLPQ
jgi:hypothetical protein